MSPEMDGNHHADRAPSKRQERRSQEVWAYNLAEEIERMSDVAEAFPYVAMDTQFPGIVARPTGPFSDYADYNYQTLKCNVDLTKVIQIGMTFSDAKGNRPKGISTWRFNFGFNASTDVFAQESIDGLRQTRGLDLTKHQSQGVEAVDFAELIMTSGLVLNEDVRWITYCGSNSFTDRPPGDARGQSEPPWVTFCGLYDFGHMLQLLTCQALPDEVGGFREYLDLFFPCRCDVAKHLHRLPQLNGDGPDSRKRSFFRNAHHILEAFFRLPDAVRRTAFEEEEEPPEPVAVKHRNSRRHREEDRRHHKGKGNASG